MPDIIDIINHRFPCINSISRRPTLPPGAVTHGARLLFSGPERHVRRPPKADTISHPALLEALAVESGQQPWQNRSAASGIFQARVRKKCQPTSIEARFNSTESEFRPIG